MLRGTSSPSTRLLDQLISSANNCKYSTLCLPTVLKSFPGIASLEVFNDWEAADEAESRSKAATKRYNFAIDDQGPSNVRANEYLSNLRRFKSRRRRMNSRIAGSNLRNGRYSILYLCEVLTTDLCSHPRDLLQWCILNLDVVHRACQHGMRLHSK